MRRLLLLLAAPALLAACQQAPARQAPTAGAASPIVQLRAEGDALMAKGDHAGALEKYRQAVDVEPGSVPIRFALGTAYSFLDKRPEAIAQFRWVVVNASAESVEHQEARRWLVRVGALVPPAESAASGGKSEVASAEAPSKKSEPSGLGSISGRTEWPGLSPAQQPAEVILMLIGDDAATRDVKRRAGIALGNAYEFKDVPAGQYRLFAVVGEETILWEQKVAIEAGKQTDLVLAKAGSRVPGYEFPEAPRSRD